MGARSAPTHTDAFPARPRRGERLVRSGVAFQSLYRKYRPQRFDEIVGQGHVVDALRAAVRDDRVGHAYLFSGPRGTGKTTSARILAKALNCLDLGDDGEPCGVCDNCVAVAAGTFFDLFELDAASNRGIDDIKELVKSTAIGIAPGSRRKVFVLDEVHALSADAATALLKSLEEPPGHVVYILATTNPEKVLPTIRSRTQHYAFGLLTAEELVGRLADLCRREGVDADPEALAAIAAAGAGSARDSESLLDQALATGTGRLDGDVVKALFGGTPFAARARILDAIAAEDAAEAIIALAELLEVGHEPRRVAEDLLAAARDAFVLTAGGGKVAVAVPADDRERLAALGDALGNAALVRVIETIGQAVTDMRGVDAADPRLVLEVALVRLSRREAGPPLQTILERIERLERASTTGAAGAAPAPRPAPAEPAPTAAPSGRSTRPTLGAIRGTAAAPAESAAAGSNVPAPAAAPASLTSSTTTSTGAGAGAGATDSAATTPAAADGGSEESAERASPDAPIDLDDVIVAWADAVSGFAPATRSAVQQAQPLRVEGQILVFGVPPELLGAARERFKREAETVREALASRLGHRFKFSLEAAAEFDLDGRSAAAASPSEAAPTGPEAEPASPGAPPDVVREARSSEAGPPDGEQHDEMIETDDLREATAADGEEPVERLRDALGATVVEEVPRDS